MKKCLDLAQLGLKKTKTNPLVGCVIVYKGIIISEGYHKKFGDSHAEVNAIKKVKNKAVLLQSTLYVNLEPCSHHGKTPPCVDLIIKTKIKNVVIGSTDPFKQVNGAGIKKLKKHTNVIVGVLLSECINLNKKYFINHCLKRPLLILKWAESKDGFINNLKKGITKISCKESIALSHKWRSQMDGIMVGTNTIICDNPKLTNRESIGDNPIRITIDRNNKLGEKKWHIMNKDAKTIILHNKKSEIIDNIKYIDIRTISQNENLTTSKLLSKMIHKLYAEGICSILIEGGKKILENCIQENLWDEMRVFSSIKKLKQGIRGPEIDYQKIKHEKIGTDKLTILHNKSVIKKIEQAF